MFIVVQPTNAAGNTIPFAVEHKGGGLVGKHIVMLLLLLFVFCCCFLKIWFFIYL
jgi:hypothetical protein